MRATAIRTAFDASERSLVRYPGLGADAFRRQVRAFLGASDE